MLKQTIRNNEKLYKVGQIFEKKLRIKLSEISPKRASQYLYKRVFKRKINLKNPSSFNEKLIWLKLNEYYNNPLVTKCADKSSVREYVNDCGLGHLLNTLIGDWNAVEEINWDTLPEKFAIKCNHGSGYNIICDSKESLDLEKTKATLQEWMQEDYWKLYAEVNYKYIDKKIICERYLETEQGFFPNDYKIYCFNGKPKAILVMSDRDKDTKGVFMDTKWNLISFGSKYNNDNKIPEEPYSLNEMLEAASKLSKPFPFVRVDFYQYNDKPIFGEMTFTPSGGLHVSQTTIDGKNMGELIQLEN